MSIVSSPLHALASMDQHRKEQLGWKVVSTGSAILGGLVSRQILQALWGALTDGELEPPLNPADRRIGWKSAVQWTVAAGIGVGMGRLVSQRLAAAGWESATGSAPPGLAD